MEQAIAQAKKLIERQAYDNKSFCIGVDFSKYSRTYFGTNENIQGYLNSVNLEGKKNALAVASSGDHAFNLITKGITNVDTFDINCLTEYFAFGFKRAMILKYDYSSFVDIMTKIRFPDINIDFLTEIVKGLLPYMESEHRIFWSTILDYNYKIQKTYGTNLNLFRMLTLDHNDRRFILYNNYLIDEEHYEKLRSRLASANITFRNVDAINLPKTYKGNHYDLILLSNILDYFDVQMGYGWDYKKLEKYERRLEKISSKDAIIFLYYIFQYAIYDDKEMFVQNHFMGNSAIEKSDLRAVEIIEFPSDHPFKINDGVILKRVK